MNYYRPLAFITTSALITACSFNKIFLYPDKMPENTAQVSDGEQSVHFAKDTYQPTFLNGKDTVHHDFTIESVVFESSNGNKLNGWLLKPKDLQPHTTLLHFHGNAGFLLSQYQTMSPLLKYGFQVFLFDYSGFGFSEGKASRKNVLKDGLAALDYVKTREDIRNTKLVIYGQSLGGHLSAVVAAERQDEIDGLVIEGAFSSHKDVAAAKAGFLGRVFVGEKYSALKSIQKYKKPLLIIHSTQDEVIPFHLGKKLYGRAKAPKAFYEIGGCHICGPRLYPAEIALRINQLLKE